MRPKYLNNQLNDSAPLSEYAVFHFAFQGLLFQSVDSGKVLTKGEFWDNHRDLAKEAAKNKFCPDGFKLVDNEGWRNGRIVN